MTSATNIDYVTLPGTAIEIKLNRHRLEAMTLLWQTRVQCHYVKHQYRLSDSRFYLL